MPFDPLATAAAFVFGAVVGSFLNVVIYRLPSGQSLVRPASRCPGCGTPIRPHHNIPIASYLFLRGRCASCKASISPRYPLVEILTGLLSAGLLLRFGPTLEFGVYFVFLAGLVAVTFIDIDHRIIPDSLSLGGIVVGFAASFFTSVGWQDSLIGLLAGGGGLFLVALLYEFITRREGMGMGDVKLIAAIGAFLGWKAVLFTIFLSAVAGSVVGVLLLRVLRRGRNYEIPYGPFLAFGAALYVFRGPEIVSWYLRMQP
jgi:leader peptidase (prepilin peptidase)/N-methyltransferase